MTSTSTDNAFIQKLSNYVISIMDKFCNYVYKDNITFRELMIAHYYKGLHGIYMYLLFFVFLFNNNIYYLTILLVIILMNAFTVVALNQCPLTNLEEKYSKQNLCLDRQMYLKNLNIRYKCEHEYEKTLELLINAWTLIALKCLTLILMKTFQIKANNCNNIYLCSQH